MSTTPDLFAPLTDIPLEAPAPSNHHELHEAWQILQQAYAQQPNPSLQQRLDWLDSMQRLIQQHAEEFAHAISQDFGNRSLHETRLAEQTVLEMELRHTRRHLAKWMRPKRVSTAITQMPGANRLMCQPVGVVGIVSPWNYPLQLLLAPAIGALAAGNRVLLKPSELTPIFADVLQQAVARHFAPTEVAVVLGDSETAKAFVQLPFGHLVFTGSTEVGRSVASAAARNLTPVTLELGGKSPALVDVSADMALAARRIAGGKLLNAGQTCIAPDYALVHRSQLDAFVQAYSDAVKAMYPTTVGNPDYTSIINARHFGRLLGLMDQVHQNGGKIIPLGDTNPNQRVLAPCLVIQPQLDWRIMQEEIFGPILPIVTYDNIEHAQSIMQHNPTPLALYWFGQDKQARDQLLTTTLAGGVTVNDCLYHLAQLNQPFGGVGTSGIGAYHGKWGFRQFSHQMPVFYQSKFTAADWLHPPYNERFEKILRLAGLLS